MTAKYIIDVRNQQSHLRLRIQSVKALAESVLKLEKVCARVPIELSISLVNDRQIRKLNRTFHYEDRATDVLAFPIDLSPEGGRTWMLGEVVVSVERALAQSKVFMTHFKKEVALYVVHGILHLLGYRDHRAALARKMEKRQDFILKKAYRGI